MAANMQHMAGANMMGRQGPKPGAQLQQYVYQNIQSNTPAFSNVSWQAGITTPDRMGKVMELISNVALAMNGIDIMRAAESGCSFEREVFLKAMSKEEYDQTMNNKIHEFFKKRQEKEPNIQNSLNANAQAQAQAQAMLNMQGQMGRGGGGPQQNFQGLQMQGQMPGQMPQQQQPQQQQQQQQQFYQQQQHQQMAMGMGMANQAGRGAGPNPQQMGMAGGQNRAQSFQNEMNRLSQTDRNKVVELAAKMMGQATEQQKANARLQIQQRLAPQQLAEFQANGRDPLVWFYQTQAFQTLKANSMGRLQQQQQHQQQPPQQNPNQQNQNAHAATMMQQQDSQRGNVMGNNQAGGANTQDFSQFANMESIKDQQMSGLIAQQKGLMVVPASNGGPRNATPQPGSQNMANQPSQNQSQNQTPRQGQQRPQQPQQGQPGQQHMNVNQNAQGGPQMGQMQGQQAAMNTGMGPSQSPAVAAVNRAQNGMNPMGANGMQQNASGFGDQRFNQGIQRPNNQAFQSMLASMTQEQRQALTPDKLNDAMRRWQAQQQMRMNAGQMNNPNQMNGGGQMNPAQMSAAQMQRNQQGQFGPMNQNMQGSPQGMQQPNPAPNGAPQQQQMQGARMAMQTPQMQAMMDSMDIPMTVVGQILPQLPTDLKKWRDLKAWIGQNNNMPQNIKQQLQALQHRQAQVLMQRRASMQQQQQQQQQQQHGQQPPQQPQQQPQLQGPMQGHQQGQQMVGMNPQMNAGIQNAGAPTANQPANMQHMPIGNVPPQVLQVTPQDLMQARNQRPNLINMPDEQLRAIVQQMKRQAWQNQMMQQQQARMRAQQGLGPQAAQMAGPGMGAPMSQQPNQTQQQPQQQQPQTTAGQSQQATTTQNQNKAKTTKNLKRPNPDDSADDATNAVNAPSNAPGKAGTQQKPARHLTPQQIANLTPEQRRKYELFLKMHVANNAQGATQAAAQNKTSATAQETTQPAGQGTTQGPAHGNAKGPSQGAAGAPSNAVGAPNADTLARLQNLAREEQRQASQEPMPDIPMAPQELADTGAKLRRIVQDMNKVTRGLSKWYSIIQDDARAKMFFRTRLRIMRQFSDGDAMSVLKDKFSIRSAELDQARAMLESMARDLAANMAKAGYMKQQGQNQAGQQGGAQQQQGKDQATVAPLNAANLEKNTQALNRMSQQKGKANQAPPAPTSTQPPFPLGAPSPHGNPSYMNKAKDMNLQIPHARKKQKLAQPSGGSGQTGSTPSPQVSKMASPEVKRAAPEPPKPVFLCKESDCDMPAIGFPTEQALQQHVDEEHTKPKENPVKFVRENLALALGLEPDGTLKKPAAAAEAPMMSSSASKQDQGQTPGNVGGTPASQDAAMKRTGSALSRVQASGKAEGSGGKAGDGKAGEATATMAQGDPWAGATIDPQALLSNLGFENGLPNIANEFQMYRSLTPNDTPESSKDSGASEPNSDISDGAVLDIDMNWQTFDSDLLLNLNNATLEGMDATGTTMDPSLLMDPSSGPPPDWDDIHIDFSKPFQLDTSLYSMEA